MTELSEYLDEIQKSMGKTYHGFTLADLEREAHPDEWMSIRDNPAALEAFALALKESRLIAKGICPERWTGIAQCRKCGMVYVLPHLHGMDLDGCRWCVNRKKKRPRPKPFPLPPSHWNKRKDGCWPYSPDCRPIAWKGIDE